MKSMMLRMGSPLAQVRCACQINVDGAPAAGAQPASSYLRRDSLLQTERDASIKIAEHYLLGAAREQQTPLAKGVDAERFIDGSLLRESERGGFFGGAR